MRHYSCGILSSSGGSERVYTLYTAGVVFPCSVSVELVYSLVRTELRHILWHGSRNIERSSVSAKIFKLFLNLRILDFGLKLRKNLRLCAKS